MEADRLNLAKRVRAQSQGLQMRLGEALALAKRGEAITVPETPRATDSGIELKTITNHELHAGIAEHTGHASASADRDLDATVHRLGGDERQGPSGC